MSTSYSYVVEYFEAGAGASGHMPVTLQERLNAMGEEGYRLAHLVPASIGYLLILEREA